MYYEKYPLIPGYPLVTFGPDSGDSLVPAEDNGSGPALNFTTPFPYLGTTETVIFVSSKFHTCYNPWHPKPRGKATIRERETTLTVKPV